MSSLRWSPYAITGVAVTAVVAFVLCCLVLRRRSALLAALATMLARFISMGAQAPHARPPAWLPPIAVLAWTSLGRRSRVATWQGSATCVAAWHRVPRYVGCCTG